jgi:NhaP-type Na+/H+ or K+/H+ antiporter
VRGQTNETRFYVVSISSETIYFVMTFVVVTLAVRYVGPFIGRPRTPWRGALLFGFIIAAIGWVIGT